MQLVDANVLLYAVNESARHHQSARTWLDQALSGDEPVAFADTVVLAFLRISTNPAVFPTPLTVDQACRRVSAWLSAQPAIRPQPMPDHFQRVCATLSSTGAAGNLTADAHLAALAIDHDAVVVTFDRDFGRFAGLAWRDPSA
jgi:uncharacterized protein